MTENIFGRLKEEPAENVFLKRILEDYCALYYINLNTDTVRIVKVSPWEPGIEAGTVTEYTSYAKKLFSGVERGESRKSFERISDIEYLKRRFISDNKASFVQSLRIEGEEEWVSIAMMVLERNEDGSPAIVSFGCSLLDREAIKREEAQRKLKQSMEIVGGVASEYTAIYHVNLDTSEYIPYIVSGKIQDIKPYYESHKTFASLARVYAESDMVDSEYRDVMMEFYPSDEAVKEKLRNKKRINVLFKRVYGGVSLWTECSIIKCEEADEEAHNVIVGFIEKDEEVKREQQNKRQLEHAEEDRRLIQSMMKSYDMVYLVNLTKDTFKRLKLDDSILESEERFFSFSEVKEFFFDRMLHPSDQKRIRQELEYDFIKERIRTERSYNLKCKVLINGVTFWHVINITAFGSEEVAIGFAERDIEITKQLLEDKKYSEHIALFTVDADTEIIKSVIRTSVFETAEVGEGIPYKDAILSFAAAQSGDVRDFFRRIANINYVKEKLAHEDKQTFSYKSTLIGGDVWVDLSIYVLDRHEDGSPTIFTIGLSYVDAMSTERKEIQERLNENMQMIGGLATEYYALYYLNMDTGFFKIYRLDKAIAPEITGFVEGSAIPYEMFKSFCMSDLVHPDDREMLAGMDIDNIREKLAHNKSYSLLFRRKYGEDYLWAKMNVIKYEDIDERPKVVAIGFSECDAAVSKEREQQRILEEALAAADKASKSKTSFLFNMSHDVRTPLNAILGFTGMAKKYADDREKVSDYLEKIDISSQHLLELISQVLEMARIESGNAVLKETPVNIKDEYEAMTTVLDEHARANGLKFNYKPLDVKHQYVLADKGRVDSITINIVGNAVKYTPNGGTIDFSFKEIEPRITGCGTYQLTVQDTGVGMSKEFLEVLYEPFARENNSTVSKIQGTGLGLSIVKNMVDMMGGEIYVDSELGRGTRFDVVMDFKLDDEPIIDEKDSLKKEVSFSGLRALLVEDNDMNREIARDLLGEFGFIIEDADDGDVAVEMVKAAIERGEPKYYDFILMDVQMPRMNGYEATAEIRKISPEGVHIPIIAMTANAFEEDRQNSFNAGMDEHLAKPVEISKVIKTLGKFV